MKTLKRIFTFIISLTVILCLASCGEETPTTVAPTVTQTVEPTLQPTVAPTVEPTVNPTVVPTVAPTVVPTIVPTTKEDPMAKVKNNISGFSVGQIEDFSKYLNTDAYRVVTTPEEFIDAIADAKYTYTNTYKVDTNTVEQELISEGTVHVIEVANDLNLGYFKLSDTAKSYSLVVDYATNYSKLEVNGIYFSEMFKENGMTQIKIEQTSNLMIYSKTGAKITHAGFKLTSCHNIVFRNLSLDEIWQWEDTSNTSINAIGDYDIFGWAYFKISHCGHIWIDHCDFGKSYDGQIDVANAVSNANQLTANRLAYGSDGTMGVSVTWCNFNGGSADPNGYLYQMMNELETAYQNGTCNTYYYKRLRDYGLSFNQILNGLAMPQKKGFLLGDQARYDEDPVEYGYNLNIKVSFGYCTFTNLEDRLPKTRGGMIYLYNCVADSSLYYKVRSIILKKGIPSKIGIDPIDSSLSNVTWKCAMVSQGIVCGQGGSVYAENSKFIGIASFIKNNDSGNSPHIDGGYKFENCYYECDDIKYTGSTTDPNNLFPVVTSKPISTEAFSWHNETETKPFETMLYSLDEVNVALQNYAGMGKLNIGNNILNPYF